jgi:hypothetical protein
MESPKTLEKRKNFLIKKLKDNDLIIEDDLILCEKYINSEINDIYYIIDILRKCKLIKINRKLKKEERKLKLMNKLEENGLKLNNSKICEEYIDGKINDIENVIIIMLEIEYLTKETNYIKILNYLIDNLYKKLNKEYSNIDSSEYGRIFEKELSLISENAKKIALNEKSFEKIPECYKKYV